jgi:hypothetical protein
MLAFLAGVFCIVASVFRQGAVGDFLSRPILIGFMNGVAISIFQGQIGSKICGFSVKAEGMLRWLLEVLSTLPQAHGPTLAIGLGSLLVLLLLRRLAPHAPAALIVMIVAGALIAALKLENRGVAVLGVISGGLPKPRLPKVPVAALPALTAKAAGLALVIFSGGVVTARSSKQEHRRLLKICPLVEKFVTDQGVQLIKYRLEVSDKQQKRRFEARLNDPLRQWKLSPMDLPSRKRWFDYSRARDMMLDATDTRHAPWHVLRSDNKKRARLNCIRHLLSQIPYKRVPREKVKLPERSMKRAYDDLATLRGRRFVPEKY